MGRRGAALAASRRRRGRSRARVLVAGTGPARRAQFPDFPGLETLRGRGVALRPLGPRRTTCAGKRVASIGTGASAIQYVPRIAARRRRSCTCSSARRRGSCRTARGRSTPLEQRLYRRFPAVQRARPRRHLRRARAAGARLRQAAARDEAARAGRRAGTASASSQRPGAAREGRRPTTRSAASASCRPTTGIRRSRARTSSSSPRASREVRERSVVTDRTGASCEVDALIFGTGFHVTDMPVGQLVRGRDGRTLAEVWDGSPARAPGRDRPRLPEPLHPARPEHRARAQLDGLHDRVPDRLRAGRAADDARARSRHRRGQAGGRGALQRGGRSAACGARSGTRAARAGTRTSRATTRRSGPTGPGASASGRALRRRPRPRSATRAVRAA